MRGLFKTLFGDWRTVSIVALSIFAVYILLQTNSSMLAGIALPVMLFLGASYLAKH